MEDSGRFALPMELLQSSALLLGDESMVLVEGNAPSPNGCKPFVLLLD